MKSEVQFLEVRYHFTQDELNQFGPIIARLNQALQEKKEEKSAVMKSYNSAIADIQNEFNENCNKLNTGYEMREIRVRMLKNYTTCQREYYSLETFELVKTVPFINSDYQRDIADQEDVLEFDVNKATPAPEGTAETNPNVYANLIRELNFWRETLKQVPDIEDTDIQIDSGRKITQKIAELEATLKAMEPESPVEEPTDESASQPSPDDTTPLENAIREIADDMANQADDQNDDDQEESEEN